MKKVISLVLALILCSVCFLATTSCQKNDNKLIVGYTIYEPMNYLDANNELVGFDTELAKAVADKLGMEIEFQKIEWSNKYLELEAGTINCIWNGFTSNCADDDGIQRSDKVDFSYAYMNNEQCVVVQSKDLAALNSASALADKKGAAEKGSAGEGVAKDYIENTDTNYFGKDSQAAAMMELIAGTVDFIVIDKTMAKAMVGSGSYANLAIVEDIEIESEVYSIGFKKGSELTEKVNGALKELAEDGTMMRLAEKYGLENYVITDLK